MTWTKIDDEPPPNGIFSVFAKYYDASIDGFLWARLDGCIQVDGRIFMSSVPMPAGALNWCEIVSLDVEKYGYRPVYWEEQTPAPHDIVIGKPS